MTDEQFVEMVARICHEANRAYQITQNDPLVSKSWDETEEEIKNSARQGVRFRMSGNKDPEEMHQNWMKQKIEDGWVYGPEKDFEKKTHPCLVPYDQLPHKDRVKDMLFVGIVASLSWGFGRCEII